MRTFSFPAVPDLNGQITLPSEVADALAANQLIEVVVVLHEEGDSEAADEEAWRQLALKSFFDGYADSDAIYDEL
ncbi:MAG: hypothetical protein ABI577_10370 [bacterium]